MWAVLGEYPKVASYNMLDSYVIPLSCLILDVSDLVSVLKVDLLAQTLPVRLLKIS